MQIKQTASSFGFGNQFESGEQYDKPDTKHYPLRQKNYGNPFLIRADGITCGSTIRFRRPLPVRRRQLPTE
jgi:hypothetical protein